MIPKLFHNSRCTSISVVFPFGKVYTGSMLVGVEKHW